ncbi:MULTISPECIES: ribonuclease HII [unclassified Mycoplasma]|uniref:ribonuclease HII n=1 Tax=unclassified Mycoplasma TaxID=2683645 RepID=UPI00211CA7D8|nr:MULTISPECIES: ribonuclease HII [unclassified Mycoplasma]UUM19797.1 ribonuclease HII [Mycoplasma sp. 1578d]UUM24781.1 ribonuclease HII [Mycoplasma sp. 3686d]
MLNYEREFLPNKKIIAGCDEAGRGSWAGPLVAACVIMPYGAKIEEINDSKKLNSHKRQALFDQILNNALEVQISIRSVEDINLSNPKEESKVAMSNCVQQMKLTPEIVITDFEKIYIDLEQINLIKGDQISYNVAAASIIAKVYRDNLMIKLDQQYPGYGFVNHKGYGTKEHKLAIVKNGITPQHRIKYKPIKNLVSSIT